MRFIQLYYLCFSYLCGGRLLISLIVNRSIIGLKKVAYIFASGALILPACALIIFNDTPMYATYSDPEVWAAALDFVFPLLH